MKKTLLLILFAFYTHIALSQADWLWANSLGGGTGWVIPYDVAVDSDENVYIVGAVKGPTSIGGIPITTSGLSGFIAKLNPDGMAYWIQRIPTSIYDGLNINSIAVDNNSIYLTGDFSSPISFGIVTLSANGREAFLAKYDLEGNFKWVRQITGSLDPEQARVYSNDVAIDEFGNAYIVGTFNERAYFTPPAKLLTSPRTGVFGWQTDIFIAKYSESGKVIWAKKAGGEGTDNGISIDTDKGGQVYIGGDFDYLAKFDSNGVEPNSPRKRNFFLASYTYNGVLSWVNQSLDLSSDSNTELTAVASDKAGNIYITGHFSGTVDFQTDIKTSTNPHIFVAQYDAGGAIGWVNVSGSGTLGSSYSRKLTVNSAGTMVGILGNFRGNCTFQGDALYANGLDGIDMVVLGYNGNGSEQFVKQIASLSDSTPDGQVEFGYGIATNHLDGESFYVIGRSGEALSPTAPVNFDLISVPFPGSSTVMGLVAKLAVAPSPAYSPISLIVYPNPASDRIYVKVENELVQSITIKDFTGSIIQSDIGLKAVEEKELILQIKQGMYILEVSTNKGIYTQLLQINR